VPDFRLGIVIPAYNEADRIGPTLRGIASAVLPGIAVDQVVVALNGTTDATAEVAAQEAEHTGMRVEVWECPGRGKAAAVAWAMRRMAAESPALDGILFMDADNATPLSALADFPIASDPGAVWSASRHAPGSRIITLDGKPSPAIRRLMSWGMRVMARLLLRIPETDTQCGFKLFPRASVEPLLGALRSRSWVFDAELLARAHRAGYTVREVPVDWTDQPGSSVRPVRDSLASIAGLLSIAWTMLRERR
jgi:dolichyl-phosphate beta-glucosyltransferase